MQTPREVLYDYLRFFKAITREQVYFDSRENWDFLRSKLYNLREVWDDETLNDLLDMDKKFLYGLKNMYTNMFLRPCRSEIL